MKYVVSYRERVGGSLKEYETAQERTLALLQAWDMPTSLKIEQFVVRVGGFGGYIVLETDVPADIHTLTTTFALFECRVEPVLDMAEAIAAEVKALAFRKGQDGAVSRSPGTGE